MLKFVVFPFFFILGVPPVAMGADKPILYSKKGCKWCEKVFSEVKNLSALVEIRDASDPEHAKELIRIGGKYQVPCLVVNKKALYESSCIIEHLNHSISMK